MASFVHPQHLCVSPAGREISYCEYGDPSGYPVFLSHGTPGSRIQAEPLNEVAIELRLRLIAMDRPGYGGTDPAVGDRLDSWSADVEAVRSKLAVDRIVMVGVSGGAGAALGYAYRHPEVARHVFVVSGLVPGAPRPAHGVPLGLRFVHALVARAPKIARRVLVVSESKFVATNERMARGLPSADRSVMLDPLLADMWRRNYAAAVHQGGDAIIADFASFSVPVLPPGEQLLTPLTIMHGVEDRNAPIDGARWLHVQQSRSELIELPGAGHLFVLHDPRALLKEVAAIVQRE